MNVKPQLFQKLRYGAALTAASTAAASCCGQPRTARFISTSVSSETDFSCRTGTRQGRGLVCGRRRRRRRRDTADVGAANEEEVYMFSDRVLVKTVSRREERTRRPVRSRPGDWTVGDAVEAEVIE